MLQEIYSELNFTANATYLKQLQQSTVVVKTDGEDVCTSARSAIISTIKRCHGNRITPNMVGSIKFNRLALFPWKPIIMEEHSLPPLCLEWSVEDVGEWIESLGFKRYKVL